MIYNSQLSRSEKKSSNKRVILTIILGYSYRAISIIFILKKVLENVEENKLYKRKPHVNARKCF